MSNMKEPVEYIYIYMHIIWVPNNKLNNWGPIRVWCWGGVEMGWGIYHVSSTRANNRQTISCGTCKDSIWVRYWSMHVTYFPTVAYIKLNNNPIIFFPLPSSSSSSSSLNSNFSLFWSGMLCVHMGHSHVNFVQNNKS